MALSPKSPTKISAKTSIPKAGAARQPVRQQLQHLRKTGSLEGHGATRFRLAGRSPDSSNDAEHCLRRARGCAWFPQGRDHTIQLSRNLAPILRSK